MLNFCDFIQVFVFTTNHHLKIFVRGTFQGFYYCSNLRVCLRRYIYKRNIQELSEDKRSTSYGSLPLMVTK